MLNKEDIEAALETGHKASQVLRDVLNDILDNGDGCFNSFQHCGECLVCISKEVLREEYD